MLALHEPPPRQARSARPDRDPALPHTVEAPVDRGPAAKRRLRCAACDHAITDRDAAISVQGGHEHHFVNPHGHAFHVALFDRAEGVARVGEPVAFYSWFPGLPWQLVVCSNCHAHLGWAWADASGAHAFYGLILPRLRDAD